LTTPSPDLCYDVSQARYDFVQHFQSKSESVEVGGGKPNLYNFMKIGLLVADNF